MGKSVSCEFNPALAAGISSLVKAHLLTVPGNAPLLFTKKAFGQWLLEGAVVAEVGMQPSLTTFPTTIGPGYDVAIKRYRDDQAQKLLAATPPTDVITGVPPELATSMCYLATVRATDMVMGGAQKAPPGTQPTFSHTAGGSLPSGDANVPGLPFPIPGFTVPGPPMASSFNPTTGVLVLIGVGWAVAVAGAAAIAVLTETEVQATKRHDVEVLAQVKVASEACAANAKLGKPCDVPKVVATLAREQDKVDLLGFGLKVVAGTLVVGGVAYGVFHVWKKGWLG